MTLPLVTLADWRAQVDKELAGAAFDKALVHATPEGLAIQPLYTEAAAESGLPGAAPFTRGSTLAPEPFAICMRHTQGDAAALATSTALADDIGGGADALWIAAGTEVPADLGTSVSTLVIDGDDAALGAVLDRAGARRLVLGADPVGDLARGLTAPTIAPISDRLASLGALARRAGATSRTALVSTLPYHDAGAYAADELAFALSTGAVYLGALLEAGLDVATAAQRIAVRVAVGRDTFGELCKLRALRLVWHKLLAAAGAPEAPPPLIHAVCSSRTLTERDPWVNMLRVTTQVFASVLGGAELVTPAAFDEALGAPSELGRRIARNTALVLREESHLGRVVDAAGGSYYLETRTDALAREVWQRFRALEKVGGIVKALTTGAVHARLDAAWKKRKDAFAKRKEAITGVSEFSNLDEQRLPRATNMAPAPSPALPVHRDAESFEALRTRADALGPAAPVVALLNLGPPAEHRARAGFSSAFFASGGLRTTETIHVAAAARAGVVVLCGSDERYASEAGATARALKAAGATRVLLAGRPGALEAALREAGVDGFIFVGGDVVAALAPIVGGVS